MTMQTVSLNKSHGGLQGVYKHASRETGTDMTFSVYVPPHQEGARLPVVYYLSGLTCTHANVTEKGEYRRSCAELGFIFVAPDTSPRGADVPGDPANATISGSAPAFMSMRRKTLSRATTACGAMSRKSCRNSSPKTFRRMPDVNPFLAIPWAVTAP